MVSPELLRRYPFFGELTAELLKEIAMFTEDVSYNKGHILLEEGHPAAHFYLLIDGEIDLFYRSEKADQQKQRKELLAGVINSGDVFAISGLIEPYVYTATARVAKNSRVLKIDAVALRNLMANKCEMGYALMHQIAKAAMERLGYTRVQLAAAWAE
jgi:CRP/FNR family transcriptional regulator, cyclic AMP receptor protein